MSVGTGAVRVGLCTVDGNYAVGFEIVSGQKDDAKIKPGSYKLIFDNRYGDANKPLLVKDVNVGSGETFKVSIGLVSDD